MESSRNHSSIKVCGMNFCRLRHASYDKGSSISNLKFLFEGLRTISSKTRSVDNDIIDI